MTSIVISILLNLAILNSGATPDAKKDKNTKETIDSTPSPTTHGGTGNWTEKNK